MTEPVWNNEAIAAAKKYNGLKYSRSQIADGIYEDTGMRFSRNAVIGKLARLGEACQKAKKIRNHAFNRPARAPVNAQHIQREKKFKSSASRTVSKLFGPEDYEPTDKFDVYKMPGYKSPQGFYKLDGKDGAPAPLCIPFSERRDGECAFICSADGAPVTVCGHQQAVTLRGAVPVKSSYCPFHHGITHEGYGTDRRRERRAA